MPLENEPNTFEVSPEKPSALALGLKMGVLTAVVYMGLLWLRYTYLSYNPMVFRFTMIFSYVFILLFFGCTAWLRRKALGGFAEIREIFGAVFICILITEICYITFNYVYLNFIEPDFFDRFGRAAIEYTKNSGGDVMKVQHLVEEINNEKGAISSVLSSIIGLGQWLIIDSILGLLISLAFRKVKPQY